MSKPIYSLNQFVNYLKEDKTPAFQSEVCFIFKLDITEIKAFKKICQAEKLQIIDNIDQQIEDLVKVQAPSQTDLEKRKQQVKAFLKEEQYLVASTNWVYFPWQQSVIRILNEKDYFSVITNRNQFKITREEQISLSHKTIGVIGLSVGGEAAVTLAQEHLCGTIRIADFDELDLSNLNRLNSGIDEVGVLKTTICARRIYRINPYLKVHTYPEGIHEKNMNLFMEGLDLLVEECDGLELKIPIRQTAKRLGINTIYAADEKGLFSIEPYGYDPNFPIFHGILKESQAPRSAFDSDVEFFKSLSIWCGGWEKISQRSRQSLLQMGQKICGYPQLASEARFAAGQLGNVARRLLLGEKLAPFIGQLDLEEIWR